MDSWFSETGDTILKYTMAATTSAHPGQMVGNNQPKKKTKPQSLHRRPYSAKKMRIRRRRESEFLFGFSSSEESDSVPELDPVAVYKRDRASTFRDRPASRSSGAGDISSSDCTSVARKMSGCLDRLKIKPRRNIRSQVLKEPTKQFRKPLREYRKPMALKRKRWSKPTAKTKLKRRRKNSASSVSFLRKESRSSSTSTVLLGDSQDYFASEDCGSSEKEMSGQQDSLVRIFATSL